MAAVDASYNFIYVDIGTNGRISDGGVFQKSTLARTLESNQINIPADCPLPLRTKSSPFVFVADDAFPLKSFIMKPFNGKSTDSVERRTYNYRLSRARRVVENAFGILANRFRVFLAPIPLVPAKVEQIVLTACLLHNFIRSKQSASTSASGQDDLDSAPVSGESWLQLDANSQRRASDFANEVRTEFCEYFNKEGRVPWQDDML